MLTKGECLHDVDLEIREIEPRDAGAVEAFITERWGAVFVVSRGVVHRPAELPGFIVEGGGRTVGLLTYHRTGDSCELVSIDAVRQHQGIGTALLEAVLARLRAEGCARLWLITTNDNLAALRFYQRRGFALAALYRGAVDRVSRPLKPAIPAVGHDGIPIRDELELERAP